MGIEFGTGGWRAIIGDGFTRANVQLLTAALAQKMKDENGAERGFMIGYDRRFLSRECHLLGGGGDGRSRYPLYGDRPGGADTVGYVFGKIL